MAANFIVLRSLIDTMNARKGIGGLTNWRRFCERLKELTRKVWAFDVDAETGDSVACRIVANVTASDKR